jgi:thiamine-monophosphate kinase
VHFLPADPPASVGWKLVAVNLSDLAAKGATPRAALLSMTIGDPDWDEGFLDGIEAACSSYKLKLIGGDTIALPDGASRVLGLTAIGRAGEQVPSRAGARPGDRLWLVGTLGDSAAGLAQLRADPEATGLMVDQYRRPVPLLAAGQAMAREAKAMMDVSDGLLIDLARMCAASRCGAEVDLDALPLSSAYVAKRGDGREARLLAATGGDDYALLAALPAEFDALSFSLPSGTRVTGIGRMTDAPGLTLFSDGEPVALPATLGFEHGGD